MAGADAWAAVLAERLAIASMQGGVVIAIVWIVCRRLVRLAPRFQASLWWLASLKLLVALVPVAAVTVPLLPPAARAIDAEPALEFQAPASSAFPPPLAPIDEGSALPFLDSPLPELPPSKDGSPRTLPWLIALAGVWLAGVAAGFGRLLTSYRRVRAMVRRSEPADAQVTALAAQIASSLGLRRTPDVRVSHEIETPQVVGLLRAVVVVPASASRWSADEQRMAMAHELAHVQRRDVVAGWIPALAGRLFFFHPLAHLAAREYLVAREAACDAAVLRSLDVEPAAYGRLLVRLGISRAEPAFGAAGSSSSPSALRRRLEMLNDATHSSSWLRRWIPVTAGALALVPLQLVARAEPVQDAAVAPIAASAVVDDSTTPPIGPRVLEQAGTAAPSAPDTQDAKPAPRTPDLEPVPAVPQTDEEADRVMRTEREAAARQVMEQAAAARAEAERAREQAAAAQQEAARAAAERERVADATQQFLQSERARLRARVQQLERELEGAMRASDSAAVEFLNRERARALASYVQMLEREAQAAQALMLGQMARTNAVAATAGSARGSLDEQVRRMSAQVEAVSRAHDTLVRQQQSLVEMQRRLAEQLEQLRTSLERLAETPR